MEQHILNWGKIIDGAHGTRPKATEEDGKTRLINKGLLFEDLIERLLKALFPDETWRRTIESNDGKRDFVFPSEEYLPDQKWAECKNYSDALSLNIIAPTLIMGAIEKIACIYFFSYSPLNANALDGLVRYSKSENKTIKVFDGNLLDSLVCKYHTLNGIDEFFPNTDFAAAAEKLKNEPLRIVKTLRDFNGDRISARHGFEMGERFYIRTILQNRASESIAFHADFLNKSRDRLRVDAGKVSYTLDFAEIGEYSVTCEALCAGTSSVAVSFADLQTGSLLTEATTRITILDEPYLAWSGAKALTARDRCLSHLVKRDDAPLLISGASGTGKSTLLDIILQQEDIRKTFHVLKVDLDLPRDICIRNTFSQIFDMRAQDETPEEQEAEAHNLSMLVSEYAESADILAGMLTAHYDRNRPYLFLVDDIQKISRPYISFFQELDCCARERGFSIYYLFALNRDNDTPEEIIARLNWDENYQNRRCETVSLSKFGKKDILTYLKTRYGLEGIDDILDGPVREITPLALHALCAKLREQRIIVQIPESKAFQIVDRFAFSEGLRKVMFETVPFQHICDSLDKGGVSEYLLKYLYIADGISSKLERKYPALLAGLTAQGLIKEHGGQYAFYHNAIREAVGRTLNFSTEDYADIFSDPETDGSSKAICALNRLGKIRGSDTFLKSFFSTEKNICKTSRRYELCLLVFDHLDTLSNMGLGSAALAYVRNNYRFLNEECGHSSFFHFLKHAADTALTDFWDMDEECVEAMAFFIKKYFDRALSSYHYEDCFQYYEKIEKSFQKIQNISEGRRYFWRSHYANRTAIALDRNTVPLAKEPSRVADLYRRSWDYCNKAGNPDELVVQNTVDGFYRHIVYRHDLSAEYVDELICHLQGIHAEALSEPMVLEYHLLLLEFLRCRENGKDGLRTLLESVQCAYKKGTSAFYTLKLYILETYILVALGRFAEADARLSHAESFAYKKEMRTYIYRITYIRANLMILTDSEISNVAYRQIVLAFEQMLDSCGTHVNGLKREVFLLKRLITIIGEHEPQWLQERIAACRLRASRDLLQRIYEHTGKAVKERDDLLEMESYFVFGGISFPAI